MVNVNENQSQTDFPAPHLHSSSIREILIAMETPITTIDGAKADERLCVVLCHDAQSGSRVELRQQTWGAGLGWFTQSTIALDPSQLGQLRSALGGQGTVRPVPRANAPLMGGFVPRVIHADSA